MRKAVIIFVTGFILFLGLLWFCNYKITSSCVGKTYSDVNLIPMNRVGLVLGTAQKLKDGNPNPYYTFRIKAAVRLFNAGKIEFVLVSGDNATIYYNEPMGFKRDLIKAGIPENKIILDYAGFRTLDSMVRAKEIFGLDSVTIISQKFHNERAIYLAERKGLTAIGFNARDVSGSDGLNVRIREYFARVKVFIDLLFNTQPKFYGNRIEIK
ncbi:YdcF family protein [Flavobacteriaceae bacterium F89]|uniref:YdcF family protein n=1 Tax=Cerina litoralis TaxID=2874477 RepID=A0AAE3EUA2_9FLAO|nr:ElyC/SanA/YdcF family protein [Cerina litoralis]MCG2459896.1 YdcF family protein [Cerina litoralis]